MYLYDETYILRSHFFFFSSRRRHTRCSRDWSSDVCSSDLAPFFIREDRTKVVSHHAQNETVPPIDLLDRKSTRLNSSHGYISYAVFCLKKKKSMADRRDVRLYADVAAARLTAPTRDRCKRG